ncbi:MAG: hypothetical protein K2X39_00410, partial [Silvanigrellaceae bacterium]|nr:hypothetical protein [Silvanigrellaceae bacterium]
MQNLSDILGPECHSLSVREKKQQLRKAMIAKRSRLYQSKQGNAQWGPAQFVEGLKKASCLSLEALNAPHPDIRIAVYYPIQYELDFTSFAKPHWLFPAMDKKNKQLLWFEYGDGILNNEQTPVLSVKQKPLADCFRYTKQHPPLICFVPGICASPQGHR